MNTDSQKNADALFAGRIVMVTHEDGSTEEIKIRQLRLADYERAIPLLDDEMALTAFCCQTVPKSHTEGSTTETPLPKFLTKEFIVGNPPDHQNALLPESYEALQAKVRVVNENGFFSFAARRAERDRTAKEEMMHVMAAIPPENLRAFSEMAKSASSPLSPKPRPTPR